MQLAILEKLKTLARYFNKPRQVYLEAFEVAASLAAGDSSTINLTTDNINRFGPFNTLRVHNASDQLISIVLNQNTANEIVVPGGSSFSFNREDGLQFETLNIKNKDGSTATSAIVYVLVGKITAEAPRSGAVVQEVLADAGFQ